MAIKSLAATRATSGSRISSEHQIDDPTREDTPCGTASVLTGLRPLLSCPHTRPRVGCASSTFSVHTPLMLTAATLSCMQTPRQAGAGGGGTGLREDSSIFLVSGSSFLFLQTLSSICEVLQVTASSGGFPDDGAGVQFGNFLPFITLSVLGDQILSTPASIKIDVDVLDCTGCAG